ncbi:T9SS type A sorting domain-containing protein [Flavobacterium sp.]|uniref:T9SS type A sorting domain-containing protein n=1 Tax=Flavobacterium sp. TaxID=239 RepID=UPI002614CEA2|nr:T9SS type A sorting domain-containing protein [Flavobacterium sp.]
MKTKLLFLLSMCSAAAFAQSVNSYYGVDATAYTLFSSPTALDQSADGTDQSWSFSGLTINGDVVDTNGTPTAGEVTSYPGTTFKSTTAGTENATATSSTIYAKEVAGTISVTGAVSDGLTLNYATDNAEVGTYPLAYGYTNTDAVAGTFNYTTYNGTFTGSLTTSIDAYGTLTLDPGPDNVNVVRLMTQQTLSLVYPGFGTVGTVTIDSYSYFEAGSNSPLFRTATTTMVVPLLSINQTKTRIEIMSSALSIGDVAKNLVQVTPNPMLDVLQIVNEGNVPVRSVRLFDVNGRMVGETTAASMDVSQLQKGIYFAMIATDYGTTTKKVVKQ